ncbi:MAG: Gldg family protein, partial [Bacteroidia bacterium]|nr:Gldg family protein [Bacteroidia bacterium]
MNRKNLKQQHLVELAATLLILVFANILSGYVFTRIDLTAERRFSLSTSTRELASGLKDEVFFKIYLAGDLPPGFRRLQNSTREILDEFRVYAGDNIQYEFINPSDQSNDAERAALYKQLAGKGLTPTNLEERDNESTSQKIIFPGAIVSTGSKEVALQLLKSRMGSSPDEMLNNSIENLEYEI